MDFAMEETHKHPSLLEGLNKCPSLYRKSGIQWQGLALKSKQDGKMQFQSLLIDS